MLACAWLAATFGALRSDAPDLAVGDGLAAAAVFALLANAYGGRL